MNDASITTTTADGVTLYGEQWFGDLPDTAPLILLFHQAGSNGRGEYGPLKDWLNEAGYRAIAWDQRAGGKTYGSNNRTRANLPKGTPDSYCDAYADLEAALAYVKTEGLADKVGIWGSSYSAGLVFQLAAKHPDQISAVIGASPGTGRAMTNCRAKAWAKDVSAPMLVLRPASEMKREKSKQQRLILEPLGAHFVVLENGVHGSSNLVDTRTRHDMSDGRAQVLAWLKTNLAP